MKTQLTTPSVAALLSFALLGSFPLKAQNTKAPNAAPATSALSGGHRKGHCKEKLKVLNEQERSQLKAALKQVRNDPQLVAARQALEDAQTKEARTAARQTLRQTRHDLLIKADPGLGAALDKIKEAKHSKEPVS